MSLRGLASWLETPVHPHAFGVIRCGLGVISLAALLQSARELIDHGYFANTFFVPFVSWLPVPSHTGYVAVIGVRILCAVLMIVGAYGRPATFLSGLLGLYVLLLDRLQFHHNRYALVLFLLLLGLSPVQRSASLLHDTPSADERWPIGAAAVAKLQLVLIYLASAGSKLFDPDWRSGVVLSLRLSKGTDMAVARGVPRAWMDTLASPEMGSLLARAAISTELWLVLGLLVPRLRLPALWIGCMFHLLIELTAKVEWFTWLMLLMYALWVTHDAEARQLHFDPESRKGIWLARLVRLFDWLRRYRVQSWGADRVASKHVLVLTCRDGSRHVGFEAFVRLTRTLPLLFPLWAPLALWSWLRAQRSERE